MAVTMTMTTTMMVMPIVMVNTTRPPGHSSEGIEHPREAMQSRLNTTSGTSTRRHRTFYGEDIGARLCNHECARAEVLVSLCEGAWRSRHSRRLSASRLKLWGQLQSSTRQDRPSKLTFGQLEQLEHAGISPERQAYTSTPSAQISTAYP